MIRYLRIEQDNTDIPYEVLSECGGVETMDMVEGLMRNAKKRVEYCRKNKTKENPS